MLNTLLRTAGLTEDSAWLRFFLKWMFIGLAIHLLGAIGSSGFYHADEHFQILEFMNYKLGRSPVNELPLEFGHLLRPWLMPAIFAGLTKGLIALGIENPFHWALVYRLFASFWGWVSCLGLALCSAIWIPQVEWRKKAVMATTLLWYIPSFHARHSSENLGGSFFFIGLSLLALLLASTYLPAGDPSLKRGSSSVRPYLKSENCLLIGVGLFFGLAFEFRYQVGFMILGTLLWMIRRNPLSRILFILSGMCIPIAIGFLADHWGYGQWTFTPWNYLKYNIIQNHVADMDATPWWDYFRRASTESWPILGILLLASFPIAWFRNPFHILTWSTGTFFLAHEIIGHKELRFLFPMLNAGGTLLILSLMAISENKLWKKFEKTGFIKGIARSLIGLNGIALLCMMSIPAWMPIRFYAQLYHFQREGFLLFHKDDSLFNFGGAIMNFYRPPHLPITHIEEYSQLIDILHKQSGPVWLFYSRYRLPEDAGALKESCVPEFSTLPLWLEKTPFRNSLKQVTNWTLFRCEVRMQ